MKFIKILNEMVEHPFINKKNITIKNNDGDNIVINCEYAKTPNEQMTGVLGMDDMCNNCVHLCKYKFCMPRYLFKYLCEVFLGRFLVGQESSGARRGSDGEYLWHVIHLLTQMWVWTYVKEGGGLWLPCCALLCFACCTL